MFFFFYPNLIDQEQTWYMSYMYQGGAGAGSVLPKPPIPTEEELRIRSQETECEICEKVFKNARLAAHHIKSVHQGIYRVACTKCRKLCANKYTLKSHMKKKHPPVPEIS